MFSMLDIIIVIVDSRVGNSVCKILNAGSGLPTFQTDFLADALTRLDIYVEKNIYKSQGSGKLG